MCDGFSINTLIHEKLVKYISVLVELYYLLVAL